MILVICCVKNPTLSIFEVNQGILLKLITYRIQIHEGKVWFVIEGIDQNEIFLFRT